MIDVFISYKQEERERMRPIAEGLRALGVDVWFDERLQPDRPFTEEINTMVRSCRAQLVCWSPAAVKSAWVVGEAEIGRARQVLVAAMLRRCELPPPFNVFHAEDLTEWRGDPKHRGWRKILVALGAKLGRPGLAELGDLLSTADAASWRDWLRKYPNDAFAAQGIARAEALEKASVSRVVVQDGRPSASAKGLAIGPWKPRSLAAGGAVVLVLGALGAVALTPRADNRLSTPGSASDLARASEKTDVRPDPVSSAPVPAARHEVATPSLDAATGDMAARLQISSSEPLRTPAEARAALDWLHRLTSTDWLTTPSQDLLERAVATTSREALVAAAETEPRAQTLVGAGYFYGLAGFAREPQTAARFLMSAAEHGDAQGQGLLGSMYATGRGVVRNDAEAVRWLRLGADQGYVGAQYNLGLMLNSGRGVRRDQAQALRYFVLAANQGHAEAQALSASMYERGLGAVSNIAEAVRYYRLAAAQGHAVAQNNLGFLYESGRGVARDDAEAVSLYRRAAAQGNADGQNNLGRMHEEERGGVSGDVEAVRLYRLAAEQRNAAGQFNLGRMYVAGKGGLRRDRDEGMRLIGLAAAQDYEPAKEWSRPRQPFVIYQ